MKTFLGFYLFIFGFVEKSTIGNPLYSVKVGTSITCSTSIGLGMKNKSSKLSFLVESSAMSTSYRVMVGLLQSSLREWDSYMMSPVLKCHPKQTVMPFWMFILDKESRRISRCFVSFLRGGRHNNTTRIYLQPASWSLIQISSQSVSNSIR